MTDDATRMFLTELPRVTGFVRKPPGTVAIERGVISARAEESDQDLDAVVAWIESHGGRLVKPPPVQAQTQRAGRRTEQTMPAEAFYVIPAAALAA
jgi:hypothetical protein